jgi:hypothetical protein
VTALAEPYKYKLRTDPQGMVGRECPNKSCRTYFKIKEEDLALPELYCPVCGEKHDMNKFTTLDQVEYINSIIFKRDEPVETRAGYKYIGKPPVDYIEMPSKCTYSCDDCDKKFGIDVKPSYCPFNGKGRGHLKLEEKCDLK